MSRTTKRIAKSAGAVTDKFRKLSEDDLDGIVGGGGLQHNNITPAPGQFDSIAGFDTSQMHLDAASMASGESSLEVAQAVASQLATDTQAIHLLEAVANFDQTHVIQALADFAGDITRVAGHANDGHVVGAEIGLLITTSQVTAAQAMSDIDAAAGGGQLQGAVAVGVLAGVASHGDITLQVTAGAEIAALVHASALTASDAASDIGAEVAASNITGDQGFGLLVGMAVDGDSATASAAVSEMSSLTQPVAAMTDLDGAVSSHAISADQAMAVLAGLAAAGSSAMQSAAAGEIDNLISNGQIFTAQAMADLGAAVASNSVTADQAVTLLTYVADTGPATVQAAAGAEIAALFAAGDIGAGQLVADIYNTHAIANALTADQAVTVMSKATVVGPIQGAVGNEIVNLIAAGEITAGQAILDFGVNALTAVRYISNAGNADNITADQTINLLANLAGPETAAVQAAAAVEIATLVSAGAITATQAVADIYATHNTPNGLTVDQAIVAMMNAATGRADLQAAVNAEIGALIPGMATASHVATLLVGLAVNNSAALDNAFASTIWSLVNANQISMNSVINDIIRAAPSAPISGEGPVTTPTATITGDQAVSLFASLLGDGGSGSQVQINAGISRLVGNQIVTATQAMADIVAAVGAGQLNGDQAVTTIGFIADSGLAGTQIAGGAAIAALVASGALTAADAAADVAGLSSGGVIEADEALSLLLGMALHGDSALAGAALPLIPNLGLPPAQVTNDINSAVSQAAITGDQAVGILIQLGSIGNAALQTATQVELSSLIGSSKITADQVIADLLSAEAGSLVTPSAAASQIASLIANNQITADQAMADIDAGVASDVLSAQMAVSLVASVAGLGSTATQSSATVEIAALMASGGITAAQVATLIIGLAGAGTPAMQSFVEGEINALITAGQLDADQTVTAFLGLAATGGAGLQNAVSQIADLISSGQITASQAMADIGGGVASNVLSATQAITLVTDLAVVSPTTVQAAAGVEVAALVGAGDITAAAAINLLIGFAATGTVSMQVAVAAEIDALVAANQITAAQAMADVGSAVTSSVLTVDQAVALLVCISQSAPATVQVAAGAEIAALVTAGAISATQAVNAIFNTSDTVTVASVEAVIPVMMFAATADAGLLSAVNALLATLITPNFPVDSNSNLFAQEDLQSSSLISTSALAQELGSLITRPDIALPAAEVNSDITEAVQSGEISASLAILLRQDLAADLGSAWAAAGGAPLTQLQMISTLGALAANIDPAIIANTVWSLINGGQTSIGEVMNGILNLGTPLTSAQTISLTLALAADAPSGSTGAVALFSIVGGFDVLIDAGQITTAQAIADIVGAAGSHQLTGDQAVALLVSIGANGDVGLQVEVGAEIATLIQAGDLSAADGTSIIATAVGQDGQYVLTDSAFGVLIGMAVNGDTATASAAVQEMLGLTAIPFYQAAATADIDGAVTAAAITADQALTVLAALAGAGSASIQNSVVREIYSLIANHEIAAAAALTNLGGSVSANLLTAEQAVALLFGVANLGNVNLQVAVGGEFAALITGGELTTAGVTSDIANAVSALTITADQGFELLLGMTINGDSAMADAAVPDMPSLAQPAAAMTNINNAVVASAITADQAMAVLAALVGAGTSAMQGAVVGEIDSLIANAHISAAQAMTDIGDAVSASLLTGDQAVALLAGIASQGGINVQIAAGGAIVALIHAGELTAPSAIADIANAVAAQSITADQGFALLLGLAVDGDSATVSAAELAMESAVSPAAAMIDIGAAVNAGAITANQAFIVLTALGDAGTIAMQSAVVGEIDALITGAEITAAQAMPVLLGFVGVGTAATFGIVASEIGSLIAAGLITTTQVAADIGGAITSLVLTADQAVTLLTYVATSAPTVVQTVAGAEIVTLVTGGSITADQTIDLLINIAGAATAATQAAAVGEINALINAGKATAPQMIADIEGAVNSGVLTADQAIGLLAYLAALATLGVQAAVGVGIAAYVTAGATTAAQAVADIMATLSNGASVDQQIIVLINAAAGGDASLQSAVAAEILTLALNEPPDAIQPMLQIPSGAGTGYLDIIGANISEDLLGRQVDIATVLNDFEDAVAAGSLTASQVFQIENYGETNFPEAWSFTGNDIGNVNPTPDAQAIHVVSLLAGLPANGDVAFSVAIAAAVTAIINGAQISAAAAVGLIESQATDNDAVAILAAMFASGQFSGASMGGAIASLIQSGAAPGALTAIGNVVGAQVLTDALGIDLLVAVAEQGNTSVQLAAGSELAALIAQGQITTSQFLGLGNISSQSYIQDLTTDQRAAFFAGAITSPSASAATQASLAGGLANSMNIASSDTSAAVLQATINDVAADLPTAQAVAALLQIYLQSGSYENPAALQGAIVQAIGALGPNAATSIGSEVTSHVITADQGMGFLPGLIGNTTASNALVVAEIMTLVTGNLITAARVVADIGADAGTGATVDQAVTLLAILTVQGNTALQTAADNQILTLIANNQIAAAQAMTDIGATIAAGTLTSDQAIALLATLAGAGPVAVQLAVANEIASLIAAGSISAARAISDIDSAITASHILTADQGMAVLTNLGIVSSVPVMTAVIGEMAALVAGSQLTATQAAADIANTIGSPLTVDQAVAWLASVSTFGNTALQAAASGEILNLIANSQISVAQAMTDMGAIIVAGTLTGDQVVAVLAMLAEAGPPSVQAAVNAEIITLIAAGQITTAQVIADLDSAITSSHVLTADQGVAVLAGVAVASSVAAQTAIISEMSSLVAGGHITAARAATDIANTVGSTLTIDQTVALLANIATQGNAALQAAASNEILALIANSQISAAQALADIGATIVAGVLTGDQAIALLATLTGAGPAALQAAVAGEIASLVITNQITAAQVNTDLDQAIASHALTADQGVGVMVNLFFSNAATQSSALTEMVALVAETQLSATRLIADIVLMISPSFTDNQAIGLMASLSIQGNAAIQAAVDAQFSAFITNNQIPAAIVVADIGATVATQALTADQAIALLLTLAGAGTALTQSAVGAELAGLAATNGVTTTQIFTDIQTAISANVLTTDQGIALLASMSANGNATVQTAVAAEIAALVTQGSITASQVMADIGAAIGSDLSADQAVTLLATLSIQSNLRAVAEADILALITNTEITATQAMIDIGNTIQNGTLTSAQVDTLLGDLSNVGNDGVQAAVGNEIAVLEGVGGVDQQITSGNLSAADALPSLINIAAANPGQQPAVIAEFQKLLTEGLVTDSQIATAIGVAIGPNFDADQSINLLVSLSAQGDATLQGAVGAELASLIATNQVSVEQVMTDILNAVDSFWGYGVGYFGLGTHAITGGQAASVLIGLAAHASADVQVAVGGELKILTTYGAISVAAAVADIDAAVSSGVLTADQAVYMLAGASMGDFVGVTGSGMLTLTLNSQHVYDPLQNAVLAEIAALVAAGELSATSAVADIVAASGFSTLNLNIQQTYEVFYFLVTITVVESPIDRSDQLLTMLLGLSLQGNTALQAAAGAGIATLITQGQFSAAQVMADIGNTLSTYTRYNSDGTISGPFGNITPAQAVSLFANIAAGGDPSVTAAVGAEIAALGVTILGVSGGAFVASLDYGQAISDLDAEIRSGVLPPAAGLAVFTALALQCAALAPAEAGTFDGVSRVTNAQIAVVNEITALVSANLLTGAQVLPALGAIATAGNGAVQTTVITDISALLSSGKMTAVQAVPTLALIGGEASGAAQLAAINEMISLARASQITATQVAADVGVLVGAGLTADQAVVEMLLMGVVANGALQTAPYAEINTLLTANQITAARVVSDATNMIQARGLNVDSALSFLVGLMQPGNAAVEALIGLAMPEIIAGNGALSAVSLSNDFQEARIVFETASQLSLVSLVTVLVAMDSSSYSNQLTLVRSYAASNSQGVTALQVIAALVQVGGEGISQIQANVGVELAAFVSSNPTDVANAITNGVASNIITGNQAVQLLADMLAYASSVHSLAVVGAGVPVIEVLAIGEMTSLITNNYITAAQAIAGIANLVASSAITGDSAVQLLTGVAQSGSVALGMAASAITSMIAQGQVAFATAASDVFGAIKGGAIPGANGALLLATMIADLPDSSPAQRLVLASDLAELTNPVFAGQGLITGDQVVAAIDRVAGFTADASLSGAIGYVMIKDGVSLAQSASDLATDVSNNVLGVDQAVEILAGASSNAGIVSGYNSGGSFVTTITDLITNGAQVAAFVTGGKISAAQAMSDLSASVAANALPPQQAIMLLGAVAAQANGNAALLAAVASEVASLESSLLGVGGVNASLQAALTYAAGDFVQLSSGQMTVAQAISDIESHASTHALPVEAMLSALLLESFGNRMLTDVNAIAAEIESRVNNDLAESGLAQLVASGAITASTANQILGQALTISWPFLPVVNLNVTALPTTAPYSASLSGGITTPLTVGASIVLASDLLNQEIVAFTDAAQVIGGGMTAATAIANVENYGGSNRYVVDVALAHLATAVNAGAAQSSASTAIMQALADRLATGTPQSALAGAITNGSMSISQGLAFLNAEVTASTVGVASAQVALLQNVALAWMDVFAELIINNAANTFGVVTGNLSASFAALSQKNAAIGLQNQVESGGVSTIIGLLQGLGTINAVESNAGNNSAELDLVAHLTQVFIAETLPTNATASNVTSSASAAAQLFQNAWSLAWKAYPLSNIIGTQLVGNTSNAAGYIALLANLLNGGIPGGSAAAQAFLDLPLVPAGIDESLPIAIQGQTMGEALGLEAADGTALKGVLSNALNDLGGPNAFTNLAAMDPDELSLLESTLADASPALAFTAVNIGSKVLVGLLTMKSVSDYLGDHTVLNDFASPILADLELISDSCSLITNLATGIITTTLTQIYNIGDESFGVLSDVFSGRDASADAAALGETLFSYSTGFQFQDAVTVGQDIGNAMVDLFTGHPLNFAEDVLTLGGDGIKLVLDSPYMQVAAATLATYGAQVATILDLNVVYNGLVDFRDWFDSVDPGLTSNDPENPGFFSAYLWNIFGPQYSAAWQSLANDVSNPILSAADDVASAFGF